MVSSSIDLGLRGLHNVEVIGSGGSAIVYKAVRQVPGRFAMEETVAVKVLRSSWDTAARRRFEREQRVMDRLSETAGFVPILETGETDDGSPYIVMPYYDGGSLQQRLARSGPLDWPRAVRLIEQVAQTLVEAHELDVFHRDIKPANILLSESGQPHVADFGISLIANDAASRAASTAAFTPAYSPPESFTDGLLPVAATDVYGLAATLWAVLAGHAPFKDPGERPAPVTVFGRVAMQQVGDLRDRVPSPICQFIERSMAKHPERRPLTMADFLSGLQAAREDAYRGVEAERLEPDPLIILPASGDEEIDLTDDGPSKAESEQAVATASDDPDEGTGFEDALDDVDETASEDDDQLGRDPQLKDEASGDAQDDDATADSGPEPDDPESGDAGTATTGVDEASADDRGSDDPSPNDTDGDEASADGPGSDDTDDTDGPGSDDTDSDDTDTDDTDSDDTVWLGSVPDDDLVGRNLQLSEPAIPTMPEVDTTTEPALASVAGGNAVMVDSTSQIVDFTDDEDWPAESGWLSKVLLAAIVTLVLLLATWWLLGPRTDNEVNDSDNAFVVADGVATNAERETGSRLGVGDQGQASQGAASNGGRGAGGALDPTRSTEGTPSDDGSTGAADVDGTATESSEQLEVRGSTAVSSRRSTPLTTARSRNSVLTSSSSSASSSSMTSTRVDGQIDDQDNGFGGSALDHDPGTDTTAATTATTLITATSTTATPATTSTVVSLTTTTAVASSPIAIVTSPYVVSVSGTSLVFAYKTNQVCGTGSFEYINMATGRSAGRWIGDRGCFGPLHYGESRWPGVTLEPGTTYRVNITVEGQPGSGSLPTGTGQASTSFQVTTSSS